jgi:hypothetical protein
MAPYREHAPKLWRPVSKLATPRPATGEARADKHRLAYMSGTRETTFKGGLVSVSSSWLALYERAASYVDRIIQRREAG